MGHNSNNMGTTWVQKYNKGVVLITIRAYTSSIGPNIMSCLQGVVTIITSILLSI